jgi:hypothetical protein
MNKFISFDQYIVNQEGKKEHCGQVHFNVNWIGCVRNLWDRHDVVISGICGIVDRTGVVTPVGGTIESIMQKIEDASL